MDWISVKDKLPDYDVFVLWILTDGNMHVEALDKDGNYWLIDEPDAPEDIIEYPKATHWQPLPEPPKN